MELKLYVLDTKIALEKCTCTCNSQMNFTKLTTVKTTEFHKNFHSFSSVNYIILPLLLKMNQCFSVLLDLFIIQSPYQNKYPQDTYWIQSQNNFI